jgi:c-di-GMP-binding flagellar brake protein YcgR
MRDRRKEPRRKAEDKVTLSLQSGDSLPGGKTSIQALTQDISTGGLHILCDARFPPRSRVKIRLVLSRARKVLTLEGEVRWVNSVYEGELFEMGIEFVDVPPPKALELLKYVYGDRHPVEFES